MFNLSVDKTAKSFILKQTRNEGFFFFSPLNVHWAITTNPSLIISSMNIFMQNTSIPKRLIDEIRCNDGEL